MRNHASFAEAALKRHQPHQKYLLELASHELDQRERNRHVQRIRAARFPVLRELTDFDFGTVPSLQKQAVLELAHGDYIARTEPVLLIGNPGLGKTHCAIGLALCACRQSHRVRFYNAATLVNELINQQEKHTIERFIDGALRHQLIVLDEFGFIPFSQAGANLLFQFCSALHDRVSLILTSNLKFTDWTQILGNQTMTAALLDRLTHRAHILEFSGTESYRLKQRAKRK